MAEIGTMSDGRRVPTRAWSFSAAGGMSRTDDDAVTIKDAEPVSASEPAAQAQSSRPRRSTLETFNDEMAVLERPLDGEAEYFDEKPASRWPRFVGFVVVVAVVGVGGSFLISRHRAAAGTQAVAAQPSSPAPAAQTAAPSATEIAPAGAAAAEAPTEPATAGDDSARPASGSGAEGGKVRNKAGGAKHARSSSSNTKHHRTTTKKTVAKRTSRHH